MSIQSLDTGFQCVALWPGTYFVDHADLKVKENYCLLPPVLGLKVSVNIPGCFQGIEPRSLGLVTSTFIPRAISLALLLAFKKAFLHKNSTVLT